MPNGEPIAVICKQIVQPTDDETGAAGVGANSDGPARITQYQYNSAGQMTSIDGPRTDTADITTFEYYTTSDTAQPPTFYKGDLQRVTNPLGQTTNYLAYDRRGLPTSITQANGIGLTMAYSLRGWPTLITRTAGGVSEQQILAYLPTGKLLSITEPDGSALTFTLRPGSAPYRHLG